jgi:hypothetical protein
VIGSRIIQEVENTADKAQAPQAVRSFVAGIRAALDGK